MLRPRKVRNNESTRFLKTCTFVTNTICHVECADPFNECLHPPLFEDTHQRRPQRFASIRRDLCYRSFGTSPLLHIASCNLLKLEVSCHVGGNEDISQLAAGHEKFGYEIDIPVIHASVLLPWLLPLVIVSVLLEELKGVRESWQMRGKSPTVSMFTEAASLLLVSFS